MAKVLLRNIRIAHNTVAYGSSENASVWRVIFSEIYSTEFIKLKRIFKLYSFRRMQRVVLAHSLQMA